MVSAGYPDRVFVVLISVFLAGVMLLGSTGCQNYRDGEGRTYGEHWDDVTIRTAIKTRLIAADEVHALNIDTAVHKSVVTLTGTVPSEEARQAALAIARDVKGVKSVIDQLEVVTE